MKIKQANKKDLNFVEKLLKENGLPYQDARSTLDNLFQGYVADQRVGICGIEIYGEFGLLRSLVVETLFRRKGYGKALCARIVEYARRKGVREIYLLTTTAEGFFQRIGFHRIERNAAPEVIRRTTEFAQLCPISAVCMVMRMG